MNRGKKRYEESSTEIDVPSSKTLCLMDTSAVTIDPLENGKQVPITMSIDNSGDEITKSSEEESKDYFNLMPNEIIINIFKELSNFTVSKYCAPVCQQWRRLSLEAGLWHDLNLAGRAIDLAVLLKLIMRGVKCLYLNTATITNESSLGSTTEEMQNRCQLHTIDLDYAVIATNEIRVLLSMCRYLEDLSLEYVNASIDFSTYVNISQNLNLQRLNFNGVQRVQANGLCAILTNCQKLENLDLSDTGLNELTLMQIYPHLPRGLKILSLNGLDALQDEHIRIIAASCPNLEKFYISRCKQLTGIVNDYVVELLQKLKYLDISFNNFNESRAVTDLCANNCRDSC